MVLTFDPNHPRAVQPPVADEPTPTPESSLVAKVEYLARTDPSLGRVLENLMDDLLKEKN